MTWPLDPLHAYVAASRGRCVHRAHGCPGCGGAGWIRELTRCLSQNELARALRVTPRTVQRWAGEGLSSDVADRAAVAAGTHPSAIWPGWDREALTPLDDLFVNGSETSEPGWRQAAVWQEVPA